MINYSGNLELLQPENTKNSGLIALDLFAGCGGLALGFEAAGFGATGYKYNEGVISTYNKNLAGSNYAVLCSGVIY